MSDKIEKRAELLKLLKLQKRLDSQQLIASYASDDESARIYQARIDATVREIVALEKELA